MTLRVLILADHFGYAGGVVHGVTTYYLNVLPRLRERGIDVKCCFLRESHPAAEGLRTRGVSVEFLGASKWNPLLAGRIERIARDMRSNILHVVNMKSALLGRLVARGMGASLIIHSHDLGVPPAPVVWLYRLARVQGERGIAVSEAAARLMPTAYGTTPDAPVLVLPNCVDLMRIREAVVAELPPDIPAAARLIGWVGRLYPVKGPQRMMRAMARLAGLVPDVHLLMIGDGPEMGNCRRLAAELGIADRVSFLGQRRDVPGLLKRLECLCMSSFSEGFPFVAIEAAAAGLPVVGYDVGSMAEVVRHRQTGLLAEDGNEEALVSALEEVLGDHALRMQLGREAGLRAESFSIERHVDTLVAEYRRTAGGAVGGAA